jgi:glucosamine--fructose-6-phosphate aminotransferase (isomerizing)
VVVAEVNSQLLDDIAAQPAAFASIAAHLKDRQEDLERAAKVVADQPKLLITGMGASLFACMPLPYLLSPLGIDARVIETAEVLHFLPSLVNARTAIVMVSRSGESIEVLRLLELADAAGAAVIGISNVPGSTLAKRSTCPLLLNCPPDQLVAIQTYSATAAAIAVLSAAVSGHLRAALDELAALPPLLDSWIKNCLHSSENWTDLTHPGAPLYLLGRGAAMASVQEGVLLMHEVAKTPCVGMSIAQFRHGPVEAAGPSLRAVVIGTQSQTASLDKQFATDLARTGSQVRWLGPEPSPSEAPSLCKWPQDIPAGFASVFEAIPLQVLAYRIAEAHGVEAVPFRWAPAITASETGFLIGTRA